MSRGGVTARVEGRESIRRALREQPEIAGQALATGIYALGNNIMTTSKPLTPKDLGVLRGSGFVTLPELLQQRSHGGRFSSKEYEVTVGFGGPAKAYAEAQHENEHYRHEEGEAKYLEKALDAHRPDAERFVAAIVSQSIRMQRAADESSFRAHPTDPDGGGQN